MTRDALRLLLLRLRQGGRVIRRAGDFHRLAGPGWPDRIMTVEARDREHRKQGRSIGRWTLEAGSGRLVSFLKRHYRLPWWRGVLATLFPGRPWSPGLEEWEHLRWAAAEGFPVPRPVAAGQYVGPWFRLQGFLAVEELAGMLPLHEAVPLAAERLSAAEFARWKRGLTAELARLARELHGRKVFHKDLYFCHFYIPESLTQTVPGDWTNRAVMIDLHRLARHPVTAFWWRAKDLAQLLYSSDVPGVTARDRLRFWTLYRAGQSHPLLERLVRWKWHLYRRQSRRRAARGAG